MAVKRTTKRAQNSKVKVQSEDSLNDTIEHLAPTMKNNKMNSNYMKWGVAVVLVLAVLVGFWYKTNSWPIVAVVGGRPVTRFEIDKTLFNQYGKEVLDNRITEMLVINELNGLGVTVTPDEVSAKIDEIKMSLGEDVELSTLLADRGMTISEFEDQLRLQLRVEKALTPKVMVSEEEINEYLEANQQFMNASGEAAMNQAKEALKYSKLQEEVTNWIEEIKAKANVWRAPGV